MLFRLILLLAIAGGLTVFALSNGSTLALTFLGMQTPTLPLSLWVLGAIAAGILTHVLIASLFRLSNVLAVAEARAQIRRNERRREAAADRYPPRDASRNSSSRPTSDDDAAWRDWEGDESPVNQPSDRQPAGIKTKIQDPIDDWESDAEDDWDNEPRQVPRPSPQPEPRSATPYSYPPRQPLGKTEVRSPESSNSVVDADFRVLVPPTRSISPPQPTDADDWFEDDDLETDEERRRRSER